jgi:hypothetical protein
MSTIIQCKKSIGLPLYNIYLMHGVKNKNLRQNNSKLEMIGNAKQTHLKYI